MLMPVKPVEPWIVQAANEDYRWLAKKICPRLMNGSRMAEILLLSSLGRMKVQKKAAVQPATV